MKRKSFFEKNQIFIILIVLMCAFTLILIQLYTYSIDIYNAEVEVGYQRIEEVTNHNVVYINNLINDNMEYIKALAEDLKSYDLKSEETIEFLKIAHNGTNFERIAIDFVNGESYTHDNNIVDIASLGYVDRISLGVPFVTDLLHSIIDNKPCISIIVPIIQDGAFQAAARGTLYAHTFSEMLDIPYFNGNGYYHLIDSNGDYLALPNNLNIALVNENFFVDLMKVTFNDDFSFESMKSDFKNSVSNKVSYSFDDKKLYAYYKPVGINGWFLMIIVPKEVIDVNADKVSQKTYLLMFVIFASLIVSFSVFAFSFLVSNKEIKKVNSQLLIDEKRYRFILERGTSVIFEYSIKTGKIVYSDQYEAFFGVPNPSNGVDVKDGNVMSLKIHPEDATTIQKIYQDTTNGLEKSYGEVRLKNYTSEFVWCSINAITIYNEIKQPIKSIGVIENISERKQLEESYQKTLVYKNAIENENVIVYEADLTKGVFMSDIDNIRKILGYEIENNYDQIIIEIDKKYSQVSDEMSIKSCASRNHLLDLFATGVIEDTLDIKTTETNYEWARYKFMLYRDPKSTNVCVIITKTGITDIKIRELELLDRSQKDQLTDLYNKVTTENLIQKYISKYDESQGLFALLIIDIDNFKTINDTLGHQIGDSALMDIASELKPLFRINDIIGRIGGDEFFVFLRGLTSKDVAINKAIEICAALRKTYSNANLSCDISSSIGISFYPNDADTYNKLYKNADIALYHSKQIGKDNYTIYSDTLVNHDIIDPDVLQKK